MARPAVPFAALRDEPLDLPAALFRAALVVPPLFFVADLRPAPAVERLAAFFVVAFFTLFFPAAFFVVLLTLRDPPTDFFDPERLAVDDRLPAARDLLAVVPRVVLPALADFLTDFFTVFFFVALFLFAAVFPAAGDFLAAAFRPAAFFPAADDFPAAAFRPAAFFRPAALFRAAGGRTVATRARLAPVSAAVAPSGAVSVPSDCSACPAFDVACEAMLTSRNAGMGRLPGWLSLSSPARTRAQRPATKRRHPR